MVLGEAALALIGGKTADLFLDLRREAKKTKVQIDDSGLRIALLDHLQRADRWSRTIVLLRAQREKDLEEHFVDLSFALGLERFGAPRSGVSTLQQIYESAGNVAILGGPGAGKTTSLQRLMRRAIRDRESGNGGVPVLIRLRDLRNEDGLLATVLAELGVNVIAPADQGRIFQRKWLQRATVQLLEQLSAIVFLDGLDEIEASIRDRVIPELQDLALASSGFRLILTCRVAEYSVALPSVQAYTLRKLNSTQIMAFAEKWLGNDHASAFVQALRRTPYAGTEVVPLLLAHLCILYERDKELPRRHIEVYEQIVALLVDKWDAERGIRRKSRHASLNWRGKERLLAALSYALMAMGRRGSFDHSDVRDAFMLVAPSFELESGDADEVIDELESHTGLLLRTGHSRYDFLHLSLQEYLAAMHARGLANPLDMLVPSSPNELAIVIAWSGDPGEYLERLLNLLLRIQSQPSFCRTLLGRLGDESPTFVPTARLGWVLLGLQEVVSGGGIKIEASELVTALLPQESVRTSIQLAVDQCEMSHTWYEQDLLPTIRAAIPPFMLEALKDRRLRAIRAPRSLYTPQSSK